MLWQLLSLQMKGAETLLLAAEMNPDTCCARDEINTGSRIQSPPAQYAKLAHLHNAHANGNPLASPEAPAMSRLGSALTFLIMLTTLADRKTHAAWV